MRLHTFLLVSALLIVSAGCKKADQIPPVSSQEHAAVAGPPASPPMSAKILTKDPEYEPLMLKNSETQDQLTKYGVLWNQRLESIANDVASISDPDLREHARSDAQEKISPDDHAKYVKDASDRRAALQAAFLAKHTKDWFEIGHVEYSHDFKTLFIQRENDHLPDASPLRSIGSTEIPIDIVEMDAIYTKFRDAVHEDIDAEVNHQIAQWRLFPNAEGSHNPVTNEDVARSRRDAEMNAREERLVLVGEGDLVTHKIDRLMLVDYGTERVVAEFPLSVIKPTESEWKF